MKALKNITAVLFALVALHAQSALAQTITTNETVFVHLNATAFVPGETLLYQLYCVYPQSNMPSNISKIAYVSIILGDKSITTQKLFLTNGTGSGSIFIPAALATGAYELIAYTNWMQNKDSDTYFRATINVINPFRSDSTPMVAIDRTAEVAMPTGLTTDKARYSARQRVTMTLDPSVRIAGRYSVSVRKREELPHVVPVSAVQFASAEHGKIVQNAFIPELRGELLSGRVTTKSGAPASGKTVAVSIPGKSFVFRTAVTNNDGRFYISIDKLQTGSNLVFQVVGIDRNDLTIAVDRETLPQIKTQTEAVTAVEPSYKNSIEKRSVASQIENAYSTLKADSVASVSHDAFFSPLAKKYALDDYTRFPTFKETIIEVVEELYFKTENGKYELHLRDYSDAIKSADPVLVLVDGLLLQDVNELFEYPMASVAEIALVARSYRFGPQTYSGIVNITTKKLDYVSKAKGAHLISPEVLRPMPKKLYYEPEYSDLLKLARIPDYRHQLLWKPDANIGKTESLTFYTSDVAGKFDAEIQGFTENGKAVSLHCEFDVE